MRCGEILNFLNFDFPSLNSFHLLPDVLLCHRGCLSRVDVEQQDTTRCRCSRCGCSCQRDQVEHRYRLSLTVARDRWIFGVTVFGACFNPQRLVEDLDGPVGATTRSTLLLKSVEDCFIGRRFIFSLKLPETESGPCLREPVGNGSSSKDSPHFIASQMILPRVHSDPSSESCIN
ncbi:DNA damage-induced apoptosis suppressor protein-like [Acanthopagrus latus]|uniref:DNA damage-induced apoptosis suppressor protein-like n=1 Tax=Acanthopagrus latus TaxID=8177 RepID=UPI00187C87C0|nr:DNA damage-induced apoptosis suppressor protein-like [Acanthopagrus latus]